MILSDTDIKKRIQSDNLLEFYEPRHIKYCGYELTIGKVVEPKTGKILRTSNRQKSKIAALLRNSGCFVVEPSETVIVITKEKLNMPQNLCATYGQLNRLSNRGLLVLNTSIVEPGYMGPLSCVLVNFSSQREALTLGEPVAKLNFHQLNSEPEVKYPVSSTFTHEQYEQVASKNATSLPKSLLDISGVEQRVTERVGRRVKTNLMLAGVLIGLLLLWSELEGFFSGWIWKHTGLMSTTKQVEVLLQQQKVEYQKENLDLQQKIGDLQEQLRGTRPPRMSPGASKQ